MKKILKGFKDYSIAFYLSTSLTLAVSLLIYKLDVEVEKNKQSFISTAKKIVGMIDVNAFFLAQVVCGICSGWHRSFFLVYVDVELKDSKTLFGLFSSLISHEKIKVPLLIKPICVGAAASLSGVGSMILFWTAKIIIGKFGAPTTVAISLMITFLRFFVFYLMRWTIRFLFYQVF